MATNKNSMIPNNIQFEFACLASELSPENIAADGEATREQVRAKRTRLLQRWRNLEDKVGRTVTESEVWGWAKIQ